MATVHRGLQAMRHVVSPRQEIHDRLGDYAISLAQTRVLVATYVRPQQTAAGVFVPDKTRNEDVFQGKVGLVLRRGPMCFVDGPNYAFGGFNAPLDCWVAYRTQDGIPMKVNGVDCRILRDTEIVAVVDHPDTVF